LTAYRVYSHLLPLVIFKRLRRMLTKDSGEARQGAAD